LPPRVSVPFVIPFPSEIGLVPKAVRKSGKELTPGLPQAGKRSGLEIHLRLA
jgi:hypothetical protein